MSNIKWRYFVLIVFILPILFLPSISSGEDIAENWDLWKALSYDIKIPYIRGCVGALVIMNNFMPGPHTAEDYTKQVDMFYSDPANRRIPIPVLIYISKMRFSGYNEMTINNALLKERNKYANY